MTIVAPWRLSLLTAASKSTGSCFIISYSASRCVFTADIAILLRTADMPIHYTYGEVCLRQIVMSDCSAAAGESSSRE